MPMSERAAAGLRAAVEWNPQAARYFMQILRDLPIGVLYIEPPPLLEQVDADTFLVIRNTGTFLQTPDDTTEIQ